MTATEVQRLLELELPPLAVESQITTRAAAQMMPQALVVVLVEVGVEHVPATTSEGVRRTAPR